MANKQEDKLKYNFAIMPGFEIIDHKEKKAVNKLFDEGGVLLAHGFEGISRYYVRDLEKNLSNHFDITLFSSSSSGTAEAENSAFWPLEFEEVTLVITQAFNFVATIEAIKDLEAKPVICNIDETLNMDMVELETLITKTKAIIPVHMLGMSSRIQDIIKLARKKGIRVLEDNCEAVGGKFDRKFLEHYQI